MDVIRKDIEMCIKKEAVAAQLKNGDFHSAHELYAVLLEELDELKDEVEVCDRQESILWYIIRANSEGDERFQETLKNIVLRATNAAVEACQVAAVAKRYMDAMERGVKDEV